MSSVRQKFLREFGVGAGGTFFRPDTTGIRGKGLAKKAYQFGDEEYPYGAADPNYGQPGAYDRGSRNGSSRAPVPVPRGIAPNDKRWKTDKDLDIDIDESGALTQLSATPPQGNIVSNPGRVKSKFGIPGEQEYPSELDEFDSQGLDEMERRLEALGVPFNSARASQGGGGHAAAGGSAGQWSQPKGDHYDRHATDDELSRAAKGEFIDRTQDIPNSKKFNEFNYGMKMSNRNPEEDEIPVPEPVGNPGSFGTKGDTMKYSRMNPRMTWREGVSRSLREAFVSMSDTPTSAKEECDSIDNVNHEFSTDSFTKAHGNAKSRFGVDDEPTLVKFLLQVEPSYFMKSFGKVGKDHLLDIYEQWADDVLNDGDEADIDMWTERITRAIGERK